MAITTKPVMPIHFRAAADRERSMDRDWLTVALCGTCLLLSAGTLLIYVFGVFVRPLAAEFHWNRTQISTALMVGQFMIAVSAPVWGWLIDRFGPRRVILPSIVALSLAFASLSLLTAHLWHLYLVFALYALVAGGSSPIGSDPCYKADHPRTGSSSAESA